ncbi:phosphatase PAP2 family protein [Solitalea koreensis]|uniref:phosphatase PAP2 family protein n=1 Tax=Solitalea koreensis TaxID=543615 RepID=UPI0037420EBF
MEGVEMLRTESFPSGHTSAVFVIVTFWVLTSKHKRFTWLLVPAILRLVRDWICCSILYGYMSE